MSWGEIKKAVNSDLSVPLDLAPIADANGDKYYPVFKKEYGFESLKSAVSRSFGVNLIKSTSPSGADTPKNVFLHEKGIYVVDRNNIRRMDRITLKDIAASENITEIGSRNYIHENSVYISCRDGTLWYFRKYNLDTLEKEAESVSLASNPTNSRITSKGIYVRSMHTFTRYSLEDLSVLAAYTIPANVQDTYASGIGFAVGGGYLTIMGNSSSESAFRRIVLNEENLSSVYHHTLISPTSGYSFDNPSIFGNNDIGFVLRFQRKANSTSDFTWAVAFYSHIPPASNSINFVPGMSSALVLNNFTNIYYDDYCSDFKMGMVNDGKLWEYTYSTQDESGLLTSRTLLGTDEDFYLYGSEDSNLNTISMQTVGTANEGRKSVYRDYSGTYLSDGFIYESPTLAYPLFASMTDIYFYAGSTLFRVPNSYKITGYAKKEV